VEPGGAARATDAFTRSVYELTRRRRNDGARPAHQHSDNPQPGDQSRLVWASVLSPDTSLRRQRKQQRVRRLIEPETDVRSKRDRLLEALLADHGEIRLAVMTCLDPAESFNDECRVAQVEGAGSGNVAGSKQHESSVSVPPDVSRSGGHSLNGMRKLAARIR
jgi:hypothetical protein